MERTPESRGPLIFSRRGKTRRELFFCDNAVKNFPAYVSILRIDLNSFARLLRLSFGSTIKGR
ncbi:hypothetical protein NNRS527_01251 [Nitrosospira sp. NRS527]|nr:hypothetical protein NNRS527_01251 [Nitrosospira sp. NRS527]